MHSRAGRVPRTYWPSATAALLVVALVGCAGPQNPEPPQQPGDNDNQASARSAEQPAPAAEEKGVAASDAKKPTAPPTSAAPPASGQTVAQRPVAPSSPAQPAKSGPSDEGAVVAVTPSGSEIRRVGPEPSDQSMSLAPSEEELARRREEASDLVYALIRIRMEEAIIHRKELLEGGRALSDVEVRRLEGVIMNARQYLVNDGEVVEPVDPPIVQTVRPK